MTIKVKAKVDRKVISIAEKDIKRMIKNLSDQNNNVLKLLNDIWALRHENKRMENRVNDLECFVSEIPSFSLKFTEHDYKINDLENKLLKLT